MPRWNNYRGRAVPEAVPPGGWAMFDATNTPYCVARSPLDGNTINDSTAERNTDGIP